VDDIELPEGFGSDVEMDRQIALLMQNEEAIRADEREKIIKAGYRKFTQDMLLTEEEAWDIWQKNKNLHIPRERVHSIAQAQLNKVSK